MSAKEGKLDKLIKTVDKLTDSKGISKLGKTLNKTLDIAGNVINSTAEVANHQLDERTKRHLDDIKLPDISGLNLDQTRELFDSMNIRYAFLTVAPDIKLAASKVDTVIKTFPKPKTVLKKGSFVKIYYLDATTLEQSQDILKNYIELKKSRKESAKGFVNKIGHGTMTGAKGILKAPKKLIPHSKHSKKSKTTDVEPSEKSDMEGWFY